MKTVLVLVLVLAAASAHAQSLPSVGIIDTGAGIYVVSPECDGSAVAVYQESNGNDSLQRDCCDDQDECPPPDSRLL